MNAAPRVLPVLLYASSLGAFLLACSDAGRGLELRLAWAVFLPSLCGFLLSHFPWTRDPEKSKSGIRAYLFGLLILAGVLWLTLVSLYFGCLLLLVSLYGWE
jgi:hypothetical protein